jgi:rhamnosyltransferase
MPRRTKDATSSRCVSIIIVTYQSEAHVASACESAFAAATHAGLEVELLVVDNASSDHSVEIVRQLFPTAIVIENSDNRGYGAACNQALDRATGDYWLLLNPDAVLAQDSLERLHAFLAAHPEAAAVGGRTLGGSQGRIESAGMAPSLRSIAGHFLLLNRVLRRGPWSGYFVQRGAMSIPIRVDWASAAVLLVRPSAIKAIGGFDATIFLYGEDVDLGIRFNRAGWQVWLDPSATAKHLGGGSQPAGSARWVDGTLEVVRRQSGRGAAWIAAAMITAGLAARSVLITLGLDGVHEPTHARVMSAGTRRAFAHLTGRAGAANPEYKALRPTPGRAPVRVSEAPSLASTAAVIVTYHPDQALISRICQLAPEVGSIVVVDNGSSSDDLNWLRDREREGSITLIANDRNLGLGEALNQGLGWAADHGYGWTLLLDQDAVPEPHLMEAAVQAFHRHVALAPAVISAANSGKGCDGCRRLAHATSAVITAGALHAVAPWRALGGFRSDFFVDYVDIEYCLRARSAGYSVLRLCPSAIIHEIGVPSRHRLLGMLVTTTNHDWRRRYYITRNRVLVWRQYASRERRYVLGDVRAFAKECVKIALFESDRLRKGSAIGRGFVHGLQGVTGPAASDAAL